MKQKKTDKQRIKKLKRLLLREQERADLLKSNLKKTRDKLSRVSELRNRLENRLKVFTPKGDE